MLMVISPAKKLDFESSSKFTGSNEPVFKAQAQALVRDLKKLSSKDLSKLMKLSDKLGDLNYERYQSFKPSYSAKNSKEAIFAFRGDTYVGLDADSLSKAEFSFACKNLRILSGLYGLVGPDTLIQPYRLEMGTSFGTKSAKNLYEYWGSLISKQLNKDAGKSKYLINLASNEYFKSVDQSSLDLEVIDVTFKEKKNGALKSIGLFSKRGRGMMARFIIENKCSRPTQMKDFDYDGYKYNSKLSTDSNYVFVR